MFFYLKRKKRAHRHTPFFYWPKRRHTTRHTRRHTAPILRHTATRRDDDRGTPSEVPRRVPRFYGIVPLFAGLCALFCRHTWHTHRRHSSASSARSPPRPRPPSIVLRPFRRFTFSRLSGPRSL